MHDAVVVGGGFYGVAIATYLVTRRAFRRVALVERQPDLLSRASYHNQARVHAGYHYPRSYTTAYRSRVNLPRFVLDYPFSVRRDFSKIYAVGRQTSKVSARQFLRFCREINAKIEPAPPEYAKLFQPHLIEASFVVEEFTFDAMVLRKLAEEALARTEVEVIRSGLVTRIGVGGHPSLLDIEYRDAGGTLQYLESRYLFNCTYSGLNQFADTLEKTRVRLKHEITELAIVEMPPSLRSLGITVMDGPFFSVLPFPPRGLHSLSHVRYTPHCHWFDEPGRAPYDRLERYTRETRIERMMRDAARYMPSIRDARYRDSMFEIKTVLVKNENDDGRPILFERNDTMPNCFSILGGKIDNIYDILERLDQETLALS